MKVIIIRSRLQLKPQCFYLIFIGAENKLLRGKYENGKLKNKEAEKIIKNAAK